MKWRSPIRGVLPGDPPRLITCISSLEKLHRDQVHKSTTVCHVDFDHEKASGGAGGRAKVTNRTRRFGRFPRSRKQLASRDVRARTPPRGAGRADAPSRREPRRRGRSPPREARGAPAPPPSASSGNPLASVTSSLRRAGTQVKRLGRKILADTTSVLPGGFQSKDKGGRSDSGRDGSGQDAGWCDENDGERDGGHQERLNSPGANEKTTKHAEARLSRPRYLDLGPLDPRHVLDIGAHFADSADPRGVRQRVAGQLPAVAEAVAGGHYAGRAHHRRASRSASVSVDLSNAAVLVAGERQASSRSSLSNAKKTSSSSSSRQFLIVTPEKRLPGIRALHARGAARALGGVHRALRRAPRARARSCARGEGAGWRVPSPAGNSFSRKASVPKSGATEKSAPERSRGAERPSPVSLPGGRPAAAAARTGACPPLSSSWRTKLPRVSPPPNSSVSAQSTRAFPERGAGPALHVARVARGLWRPALWTPRRRARARAGRRRRRVVHERRRRRRRRQRRRRVRRTRRTRRKPWTRSSPHRRASSSPSDAAWRCARRAASTLAAALGDLGSAGPEARGRRTEPGHAHSRPRWRSSRRSSRRSSPPPPADARPAFLAV